MCESEEEYRISKAFLAAYLMLTLVGLAAVIACLVIGKTPRFQASFILFVGLALYLSFAPLTRTNAYNSRSILFSAFTMIAIPVLTFGKLAVVGWSFVDNYGEIVLVPFVIKVLVPIAIRFVVGKQAMRNCEQPVFIVAHALNAMVFAPGMFQAGSTYLVGYYLAWVSVMKLLARCRPKSVVHIIWSIDMIIIMIYVIPDNNQQSSKAQFPLNMRVHPRPVRKVHLWETK
jgi:hypothetical protein